MKIIPISVIRILYNLLLLVARGLAWLAGQDPLRKEKISRILVVELTKLGDVVSTLPFFASLKDGFPQATIAVLVQPGHDRLFSLVPEVDTVLTSSPASGLRNLLKAIRMIRRQKYDLVISASPSVRHGTLLLLSGAGYKFGYLDYSQAKVIHLQSHRIRSHGFRLSRDVPRPPSNLSDRSAQLCDALGLRQPRSVPIFQFLRRDSANGREGVDGIAIDKSQPYIVIHPFASWSYRTWPIENFEQLIRRILGSSNHQILIIGSESDRKGLDALIEQWAQDPQIQFGIGLPLDDLARIIAKAHLFIGADSGPLHLAAAVGTRSIGLFGPAPPEFTGPPVDSNTYFYKKVECSPCDQEDCVRKWKPCMTLISVDEVFERVNQTFLPWRDGSVRHAASLPESLQDRRASG